MEFKKRLSDTFTVRAIQPINLELSKMLLGASYSSDSHLRWVLVLTGWIFCSMVSELTSQEVRERESAQQDPNGRLAPGATATGRNFGARGSNQNTGVVITSIVPGSPAQLAGIEVRDQVITVNGYQVGIVNGTAYDLEREVWSRADRGQPVVLLVKDWRTNNLTNITIDLNQNASQRPPIINNQVASQLAQVRIWYDQYLQRPPSESETTAWRESLSQGGLTLQDIQSYILGSTEFYDRFGRNNDVGFVYALYDKVFGRQPTQSELSRTLSDLSSYGGNRVPFVKSFLANRPNVAPPPSQGLSTKELLSTMTSYQKQMSSFVTWGFYGEQSATLFKSIANVKRIEQYEVPGRENRQEQQRLASEVQKNSDRLVQIAQQIRDRADRTNSMSREASKLMEDANRLKSAADRLIREVYR